MLLEEFGGLLCMQKDVNAFWRSPPQGEPPKVPKVQPLQACRAQDARNPAADPPAALLCAATQQTKSARPGARIDKGHIGAHTPAALSLMSRETGRSIIANCWCPCSLHHTRNQSHIIAAVSSNVVRMMKMRPSSQQLVLGSSGSSG